MPSGYVDKTLEKKLTINIEKNYERKPTEKRLDRAPTINNVDKILEKKPTIYNADKTFEKKPTIYNVDKTFERKPTASPQLREPNRSFDRNQSNSNIPPGYADNNKNFDRKPTSNGLIRQPTKNYEKKQTAFLAPSSQEIIIPSEDRRAQYSKQKSATSRNNLPVNPLSEVKEVKEEPISPRKHKILDDILKNEAEQPSVQNIPEKQKEDDSFFTKILDKFKSKKDEPMKFEQLPPSIVEHSTILKEIYSLEKPVILEKDKNKPLGYSRLLTNLNDIWQPEPQKKPNNPELDNFLYMRNSTGQIAAQPLNQINLLQPTQTRSIYENLPPPQPILDPYGYHKAPLANSLNPILPNNELYKPTLYSSYNFNKYNNISQPTVRSHMSNDEVKDYLRNLDRMLGDALKKHPKEYPKEYEYNPKSVQFEEPLIVPMEKSLNGMRYSERGGFWEDNEELQELREKYSRSNALGKSVTLLKKNMRSMELSQFTDVKIGDVICANCDEFMTPEEYDTHSLICVKKINDVNLKRINQKIEKMKYLLIINFKNAESGNKQSYVELEELMNIGLVLIDLIQINNKSPKDISENTEDLETLVKNLPTLSNKSSKVFKVLCNRVIQLANVKIDLLKRLNTEDPDPLKITIPKAKWQKKVFREECCGGCYGCGGGCGGCCGRCCGEERVEYERMPPPHGHITAKDLQHN